MAFFDRVVDHFFETDSEGKVVYFPNLAGGEGYFVPSQFEVEKMRSALSRSYWFSFSALAVSMAFAYSYPIVVLILVVALDKLTKNRLAKGLSPSSLKLDRADIVRKDAEAQSTQTIILVLSASVIGLIIGCIWFYFESRTFLRVGAVALALVSLVLARQSWLMLRAKRQMRQD